MASFFSLPFYMALFRITTISMILLKTLWKTPLNRAKTKRKTKKHAKSLFARSSKTKTLCQVSGASRFSWKSLSAWDRLTSGGNQSAWTTFVVALAVAKARPRSKGSLTSRQSSSTFDPWSQTQSLWRISSAALWRANRGSYLQTSAQESLIRMMTCLKLTNRLKKA